MSRPINFVSMPRRSGKTALVKERLEAHIKSRENSIVIVRDKKYISDWSPELLAHVFTPQEIRGKEMWELHRDRWDLCLNRNKPLRVMADDVLWDNDANTVAQLFYDLGKLNAEVESYSTRPEIHKEVNARQSGIRRHGSII